MEAIWLKSARHCGGLTGELSVVVCLSFCRRDVPNGLKQPVVVEPGHPFERGQFHGFLRFPYSPAMDQLGFVQYLVGPAQFLDLALQIFDVLHLAGRDTLTHPGISLGALDPIVQGY